AGMAAAVTTRPRTASRVLIRLLWKECPGRSGTFSLSRTPAFGARSGAFPLSSRGGFTPTRDAGRRSVRSGARRISEGKQRVQRVAPIGRPVERGVERSAVHVREQRGRRAAEEREPVREAHDQAMPAGIRALV